MVDFPFIQAASLLQNCPMSKHPLTSGQQEKRTTAIHLHGLQNKTLQRLLLLKVPEISIKRNLPTHHTLPISAETHLQLLGFFHHFFPSKQTATKPWLKKKTGQKPSHEGVLPLVCQGTGDFGDAQNTKNSMLPAASETNAVGIAIVAVGLEPAKIHCIHVLLRFFFTPLVLGTIIVKGKQEKGTSQFVGLVFHNIYFLGIKGKQQKGIESKLQNAHALCLHTLAPCSIQRRRASAKRRQAVHMCQGPRRALPGSFYGLAPRKLAISILHFPSS